MYTYIEQSQSINNNNHKLITHSSW